MNIIYITAEILCNMHYASILRYFEIKSVNNDFGVKNLQ